MVNVYFRILGSAGNPVNIKPDLAAHEREGVLLPLEKKMVIHPYSDDFHLMVLAYSLEEIVAEKIRALFERTRPRDLYEVWRIHNEVDDGKVLNIL